MSITDQIEADILRLPPSERERLAIAAWESLAVDETWLADPRTDSEGLALARRRDDEIESGQVMPLNHEEFLTRTRGHGG
jgi:hypothetical protein